LSAPSHFFPFFWNALKKFFFQLIDGRALFSHRSILGQVVQLFDDGAHFACRLCAYPTASHFSQLMFHFSITFSPRRMPAKLVSILVEPNCLIIFFSIFGALFSSYSILVHFFPDVSAKICPENCAMFRAPTSKTNDAARGAPRRTYSK